MTWRPLLEAEPARIARELVDWIVEEVARRDVDDASFGTGQAGIALLHGYRALDGAADGADLAVAAISRALDNVMADPRPWLFFGYAGTAFAMHHLADVIGDTEDTLAELDALVATTLAKDTWPYRLELMTGVIGLGVYGLARGQPALVERAVVHLDARAERTSDGITWRTVEADDTAFPDGYYNLGIAHGQTGAIGFLADATACCPRAGELLRGAVAWLRLRERPDHVPRFPMTIGARTVRFEGTLDGWCYGDASTAIVLVRAGLALQEPTWVAAAHDLARHAARRSPDDIARLTIDASLCHGAISQAHMFNRLAQFFDDAELGSVARQWYGRALEVELDVLAVAETGIQMGIVGLALGLLAGVSTIEPAWDRALLVQLPVR